MHIHCYGNMYIALLPNYGCLCGTALAVLFQLLGVMLRYCLFYPLKNALCTSVHFVTRRRLLLGAQGALVRFSRIGPVDKCLWSRRVHLTRQFETVVHLGIDTST